MHWVNFTFWPPRDWNPNASNIERNRLVGAKLAPAMNLLMVVLGLDFEAWWRGVLYFVGHIVLSLLSEFCRRISNRWWEMRKNTLPKTRSDGTWLRPRIVLTLPSTGTRQNLRWKYQNPEKRAVIPLDRFGAVSFVCGINVTFTIIKMLSVLRRYLCEWFWCTRYRPRHPPGYEVQILLQSRIWKVYGSVERVAVEGMSMFCCVVRWG